MAHIGPTADGIVIEAYIAQLKSLASVAASPIGASSQSTHRSEFSAGAAPDVGIKDTGPICSTYDPEFASAIGVDLA